MHARTPADECSRPRANPWTGGRSSAGASQFAFWEKVPPCSRVERHAAGIFQEPKSKNFGRGQPVRQDRRSYPHDQEHIRPNQRAGSAAARAVERRELKKCRAQASRSSTSQSPSSNYRPREPPHASKERAGSRRSRTKA